MKRTRLTRRGELVAAGLGILAFWAYVTGAQAIVDWLT